MSGYSFGKFLIDTEFSVNKSIWSYRPWTKVDFWASYGEFLSFTLILPLENCVPVTLSIFFKATGSRFSKKEEEKTQRKQD